MTALPESFKDEMSLGDFWRLSMEDRAQVVAPDGANPLIRHCVRLMGGYRIEYKYTIDHAIPNVLGVATVLPVAIVIGERHGSSFLLWLLAVVFVMLLGLLYYFVANLVWIKSAGYRYNWWTRTAHKTPDHKAAK